MIVGAGPAGLSAALMLGRCRRKVVVIDDAAPRNAATRATHGFLTRDGAPPATILKLGRAEVAKYPSVHFESGTVTRADGVRGAFVVHCDDGRTYTGRRLLIATGVVDELPEIAGLEDLYGRSVHHCPFCDAYEYVDEPLAQYGRGQGGIEAALFLRGWSEDVVLITDGDRLGREARELLEQHGIAAREEPVARLVGRAGKLKRIEFRAGPPLVRTALFFATTQEQRSDLARSLGCDLTPEGEVMTKDHETTNVPGVYVAGDASHREQKLAVAASEGTQAAIKIHQALWNEDLRRSPAQ